MIVHLELVMESIHFRLEQDTRCVTYRTCWSIILEECLSDVPCGLDCENLLLGYPGIQSTSTTNMCKMHLRKLWRMSTLTYCSVRVHTAFVFYHLCSYLGHLCIMIELPFRHNCHRIPAWLPDELAPSISSINAGNLQVVTSQRIKLTIFR